MFGLPERASNLVLNFTNNSDPYYMFNTDRFPHFYQTNVSLYGSLPYLTAHEAISNISVDSSVMWMNSAPTWVDLFAIQVDSTLGTFNSMGGAIELFLFASTISPLRVQKSLSDISGYVPMPPLHSLGFHFSKYEYFTALSLAERS
jgi:alpha 1,3-glucosidase